MVPEEALLAVFDLARREKEFLGGISRITSPNLFRNKIQRTLQSKVDGLGLAADEAAKMAENWEDAFREVAKRAEEAPSARAGAVRGKLSDPKFHNWLRFYRPGVDEAIVLKNAPKTPGPAAPGVTGVTAPKSARKSAALKALKKLGPKALGIGMLGKLASLPGVAEAAEVVARDEPSVQRFFQDYESMLGASPAREEFPVFELDEERRRAASAQMRSGRTGLRPGFDEPPITEEEELFVRSAPRPRRRK